MRKSSRAIILLVLGLIIFSSAISCNNRKNNKVTFVVEQFQDEMKSRNYDFDMQDDEEDFLPTTRKRMLIDKEILDIYLFSDNERMENEAKHILSRGNVYKNGVKVKSNLFQ